MDSLSPLFSPSRVAVIGSTPREGSVGRAVTENLLESFDGTVIPVNPNYETAFEIDCVDSIADADADLAVVVVPPEAALEAIEACGIHGVSNVVVITAGFSETGPKGARREQRLRELTATYDLNVVGPNSLGVISTRSGLNATFGPDIPLSGRLSFMSQSGAFITAVLDWATDQGIGFNDVVSLGNKAVLDEIDLIEHWGDDDETDVIVGYLEGIDDGRSFIDLARTVVPETPIVVIKSGRTDAGAKAASSHTGTIAGSEQAYEAGLRQAGVLRATSAQGLFDTAEILATQPIPSTDGVAVITNAGGPGVMATDAIGDSALEMASFGTETVEKLQTAMPGEANVHNPVDAIGDADAERLGTAAEIAAGDESVGMLFVLAAPTAVLSYENLTDAILEVAEATDLPVVTCFMGGDRTREPKRRLRSAGVPCYFDPSDAVDSLDALLRYRQIADREYGEPTRYDVDRSRALEVLRQVRRREDNRLGVEAMELLDAYGIETPDGEIVDSADRAQEVAAELDGDVVMKIVSPDILHKSDIGGVKLGVSEPAVEDAYEDLLTRAHNYQPDARVIGVQIQESVDIDAGVETILGSTRDPQFGPLLLFGLGGIFVEILEDTAVRVAPISKQEARRMTEEIRTAPILHGARGRDPVDIDGIVESLGRLSQLVTDFPAILELDVNPLVATADGVTAIDIRLTVDPEELPTDAAAIDDATEATETGESTPRKQAEGTDATATDTTEATDTETKR
ncbi:MAG: acetate--CoA ligase family protein [Natronomonas sp.]